MKKALFFLAFAFLCMSGLQAQPVLTINNNTSCTLYIQANAFDPNNCTNPIIDINTALAPGTYTIDAAVLCSCTPTNYEWASARAACFSGTLSPGSPCYNNVFTIGDGTTCNAAPSSACMNVDPGCGTCGSATGIFTPTGGGNITLDIN